MDYHTLSRRQLQSLCKKHGIPANATNLEMADALSALLTPKPDNTMQSLKTATRSQEPAVLTTDSKVKDLESSEIQVQNASGSDDKCNVKPQRATRSRGCLTEASTSASLKMENSKNCGNESTSAAQKQQTKSVSTRRRAGNQDEDGVQSKSVETKVESPTSDKKKDRASRIVLRRGRVKVRSPRSFSKTAESDKSLKSLAVNAKANEVIEGESVMSNTQSCLLDTQKIQLRKNKRVVTFSDVLAETRGFSESPPAEELKERTTSFQGLAADQENQSLVSTREDKKVEGSSNGSRRASRRDCIQGNPTLKATQQKSRKVGGTEPRKDLNILPISEQSYGNHVSEADALVSLLGQKKVGKENCSGSRSRRRSICGRRVGNEAALALNEKEMVADNHILSEEVPLISNTRHSRRMTPIPSDFNTGQDKKMFVGKNEDEKVVDSSVQGNLDNLSVTNTRRSRRLTILPSELDLNQAKTKINETLQEKSNDGHEDANLIAPTKEAGCEPHVEASCRGRRRTLAPPELNHTHIHLKKVGEQMKKTILVEKNTNNEEHAINLMTGSHNAPPRQSKAKISARISLATDPTKLDAFNTSENVCRSRQKISSRSVVRSNTDKKKTSNIKDDSDKDARAMRKHDAQVTARETRPGAGSAENELHGCETVLEEVFKREKVQIAATPDSTHETDDILLGANGPEEGGIQTCRSILEDLTEEFEDPHVPSKSCSDDSFKKLAKDNVNLKRLNTVNSPSTININSAKNSDSLFSTTGSKLEGSSAEGPGFSPSDAQLNGIFQAIEVGISETSTTRADIESSSNSSKITRPLDVTERIDMEDSLSIEAESVVPQELLAGSVNSPFRQLNAVETRSPKQEVCSDMSPLLTSITSDEEGIIDSNETLKRNSSGLTNMISADFNIDGNHLHNAIAENKIECSISSRPDKNSSSTSSAKTSSDMDIDRCIRHTAGVNILDIVADAVVKEDLPDCEMKSPSRHQLSAETCAPGQEMCSDNEQLVSHVNECLSTKDVECDSWYAEGAHLNRGKEVGAGEEQELVCKCEFVDVIQGTNESRACELEKIDPGVMQAVEFSFPKEVKTKAEEKSNDHIAGRLQVSNEGTQFDGASMLANISIIDNQVRPLRPASIDFPGNTLPIEVGYKIKQRGPRAIYKSARKTKPSGLQEIRSFTEMGFGPSTTAGCFMPCDREEDFEVQGYSTPDMGSEEGDSEEDSFSNEDFSKFKPDVLPLNADGDASWCEENTQSDIGEDTAFGSKEEEVDSDDESYVSEGDTSEQELSESDEDVSLDDSGSPTDHDSSPVLQTLPLNADGDASWCEENTQSDIGEDTAFGNKEEEVDSDDESYVSEGDTSEQELSESDEDVSSDDFGSPTDHDSSPVLHTAVKSNFSKVSSCSGHLLEVTRVEHNAAALPDLEAAQSDVQQYAAYGSSVFYEKLALGQGRNCQLFEDESDESNSTFLGVHSSEATELLSNDHNSLPVVDVKLATHVTCQNDTPLASLFCLFATPQSKVMEATNCSSKPLSTGYQLPSEGVFAENGNGQQSVDKAESRTEFCTSFSALEQKENGQVFSVLQRGSLGLSFSDQAVNDEIYQAVELSFEIDGDNKEVATEDGRAETLDICEGVYTEALTEDLGAGKTYPDTLTRTVKDGLVTDEQTEELFGVGASNANATAITAVSIEDAGAETPDNSEEICSQVLNEDFGASKNYTHTSTRIAEDGVTNNQHAEEKFGVEAANVESTTITVDLDLKGSKYHLSTADLLQNVECNLESDITDVEMGSAIAPPAVLKSGKEETVNSNPEWALVKKADSNLCQAESQLELSLCDISDEGYTKLSSEEQGEDLDLKGSKCHFSTGALLQNVECNLDSDITDVEMGSAIAPPAVLESGKEETINSDPEWGLVKKSESYLCQAESQSELLLCDISDESCAKLSSEEQGESSKKSFTSDSTECRDSEVVLMHESLVDEPQAAQLPQTVCSYKEGEHMRGLVDELLGNVWNETQAAQSPQIPQTPRTYAEGEHVRGLGDELLENVLNAMTQQCVKVLRSETEAVHCAEIPQASRADAKGELKSETHGAEIPPELRADAKGELKKAEVDKPLDNVSNESETCATCSTYEPDGFKMQDISQAQCVAAEGVFIGAPMEELLETVLNKAQACENHISEVIKEPVEADVSLTEISREQSLQHLEVTLMSLRKLKQMCKENDFSASTKPVTETPSRREGNAWMPAKKANTSVQPKDLPSANKRSALKALSSNIKSTTPASSARTPMAKNMQRPRNLMSNYDNSEGAGRNLVASSPQAPSSSRRDIAKSVRH